MAIIWNKIIPRWGGTTIEPPEVKKDEGYLIDDVPPASWENWLRKGTYEALDETRDVIEGIDSQLAQEVQNLVSHKADSVTDADGAHGFKIEEGTFTPLILFGGNGVGTVYTRQLGRYKRIGNLVHIQIDVILSEKGSSVGNVTISGLPFASNSTQPVSASLVSYHTNIAFVANALSLTAQLSNGSNSLILTMNRTSSTAYTVTNTELSTNVTLRLEMAYHI